MTDSLADRLLPAVMPSREHTAIVVRAIYQPVGRAGRTVMPPTYPVNNGDRDPNAKYLVDSRLVDGEQRRSVVMDQEPSQANRWRRRCVMPGTPGTCSCRSLSCAPALSG